MDIITINLSLILYDFFFYLFYCYNGLFIPFVLRASHWPPLLMFWAVRFSLKIKDRVYIKKDFRCFAPSWDKKYRNCLFVCLFCRAVKKHLELHESLEEGDSKVTSERHLTKTRLMQAQGAERRNMQPKWISERNTATSWKMNRSNCDKKRTKTLPSKGSTGNAEAHGWSQIWDSAAGFCA